MHFFHQFNFNFICNSIPVADWDSGKVADVWETYVADRRNFPQAIAHSIERLFQLQLKIYRAFRNMDGDDHREFWFRGGTTPEAWIARRGNVQLSLWGGHWYMVHVSGWWDLII